MSNLATITNNILADSGIDDINVIVSTGSYANPAWITSLAWTKITGAPANIVTGTGSVGQVAYWSSSSAITGESNLFWDASNDRLGIGNATPLFTLDVNGTSRFSSTVTMNGNLSLSYSYPRINLIDTDNNSDYSIINADGVFTIYDDTNAQNRILISSIGLITLPNLSGTGTRMVVADASGTLSTQTIGSGAITGSGTTNYLPKFTGSTTIGNSNLINDVNGNLGLGVTPPAWSIFNAINILGGSFSTNSVVGGGVVIARNWYFDGNERYFENGTAQRLELVSNGFFFQTAVNNTSGAGAALTWNSQMTLFSSGNLTIGATADAGFKLDVNGTGRFSGIITTTSTSLASGNFGGNSASWEGNSQYPTLFGSSADRWIMHINPHVSYTQNGVNGFTGSMTGATVRFASNPAAASYWDIGVGTNSVGTDKMSFGRAGTNFLTLTNLGYLVLGNTSSVYGQAGRGTFEMNGSADNIFAMRIAGSLAGYLYTNTSNMELYSTTNIQFSTAGAIRATLFTDGNFTLSNSPSNAGFKLDVNGTGRFSSSVTATSETTDSSMIQQWGYSGNSSQYRLRLNTIVSSLLVRYSFDLVNNGTTYNNNLVLDRGNVGIGLNTPSTRFEVASGNSGSTEIQRWSYNDGNAAYSLRLKQDVSSGLVKHVFDVVNNSTTYSNNLVLTNGNVLIGTTSDNGSRLQVSGNASITNTNPCLIVADGTNTSFFATASVGGAFGVGVVAGDAVVRGVNGVSLVPDNGALTALRIASNGNATFSSGGRTLTVVSTNDAVPAVIRSGLGAVSTLSFQGTTSTNDFNTRIGCDANDLVALTGNEIRFRIASNGSVSFQSDVTAARYYNPGGPYGTGQANARNHFTQFNAGNATLAGGWISGAFGDALGNRIVIGQYQGVAVIAGHNNNLDAWASMSLASGGGNVLIGTITDNGARFQVAGTSTLSGQLVQGGGAQRSTNGTTIAFTGGAQTIWTANTDCGDNGRFLSIVNENASTNAFSALSFRVNPGGGGIGNAMLDIKFVNNGSGASTLYWSFLSGGSWFDRMFLTSGGALTASSFFESSDLRLKSNIINLDVDVSSILAKKYIKDDIEEIGYIAQDVESILPSAISKRKDGYLDLSYRQVHTAKIAALEKRITELELQLKNN